MAAAKPRARADLSIFEFDSELVVYDPASGGTHYLNPTASLVFRLCDGTATIRETGSDLAEALGVPGEAAESEVRATVQQLRAKGLLERARNRRTEKSTGDDHAGDERERIRMQVPRST